MDSRYTGKVIQTLRKAQGLTQKELAEKLNVTDKAVSKWERGINYPDVSMFPKIAEILGSSVPELLGVEAKGTESISELLEQIIKNRKQNEIASIKKCLLEEKKKIFILILSGIMPIGIGYYLNWYMLNHYDFVSYEPIWMAILFAWGYIACFAKKYISNKVVVICSQNLVAFMVLILNMFQEYLLQRYVFQWTQFYYLPLINLGGKFEFTHTITGGCIVVLVIMILVSGIGCMMSLNYQKRES